MRHRTRARRGDGIPPTKYRAADGGCSAREESRFSPKGETNACAVSSAPEGAMRGFDLGRSRYPPKRSGVAVGDVNQGCGYGNTSTLATFPFRLPHKALQLTDHIHRKRQERISTFAAKAVGGLGIWKQRRLVHIEADGKITFLLVQEEVQRLEAAGRATLYLKKLS